MTQTDKQSDLSVVMPVGDGAHMLQQSLPPLMAMQRRGELAEVIVVDDASQDDTAAIATEWGARVIRKPHREGPGAARNLGVAECRSMFVWFVDADVIVHADTARAIRAGFSDPDTAAVFGSYDDRPPADNFLSQYKNLVHHYCHQRGKRRAWTFWAGCGAVRRERFEAVGGFDAGRYPLPSIEDIELGYRLCDDGGHCLLLPAAQATHLKVWRFYNLVHTEIFRRALPWSRLIQQRQQPLDDLNVAAAERWRAIAAGVGVLVMLCVIARVLPFGILVPIVGAIVVLNYPLVRFFARKRGRVFSIRAVAFHQLYYLYSGTTFVYARLEASIRGLFGRHRSASA